MYQLLLKCAITLFHRIFMYFIYISNGVIKICDVNNVLHFKLLFRRIPRSNNLQGLLNEGFNRFRLGYIGLS
jgi:hypothetical protein